MWITVSFVKPSKPSLQAQCLFPVPTYIQKHPENSACVAVFPSCANLEGSGFFHCCSLGQNRSPGIIKPIEKLQESNSLHIQWHVSVCGFTSSSQIWVFKTTGLYMLNGLIGLAELPYRTGRGHWDNVLRLEGEILGWDPRETAWVLHLLLTVSTSRTAVLWFSSASKPVEVLGNIYWVSFMSKDKSCSPELFQKQA